MSLGIDLKPESGGTPIPGAEYITISSDYFRVMGMRLIEGRALSAKDRNSSRAAYVINRTLARMYSPHSSAIGKTITSGPGVAAGEVVGVVNDSRRWGPDAEPKPSLFVDAEHTIGIVGTTDAGVYFVIRTANKPAFTVSEIRRIVRELDPTLAVDNVATMNQILSNAITTPRSYAVLLGTFAVSALALATIGLYGLLAYFVSQRTQEIGVRLAIGAERSDVLLLVLRQGLAVGATGLTLGVAGGLVLTRYLQTMLFGVPTLDFATFLIVTSVFIAVTLAASLIPAHRAASIDPLIALRYE
jgi:putative ABC transport system permease protein